MPQITVTSAYREEIMKSFFDERELEVVPILFELCKPVMFEPKPCLLAESLSWGSKKTRSIPSDDPPLPPPSSSLAPAVQNPVVESDSPVTPLSFSPSKIDENCTNSEKNKNVSSKRERDESVESKNQEIMMMVQPDQAPVKPLSLDRQEDHRRPQNQRSSIDHPTALGHHRSMSSRHPNAQPMWFHRPCFGFGMMNSALHNIGTHGIDLNLPPPPAFADVEVHQPSNPPQRDDNVCPIRTQAKLAAAEARKRRKEIYRAKKLFSRR